MNGVTIPDARDVAAAIALLIVMGWAGWIGRRQVSGVVMLTLLSFAWLTVDKLWEVKVLVGVDTDGHSLGLTVADLVAFLGFGVAGVEAVMLWRRRR